jgi:hypothetical protein
MNASEKMKAPLTGFTCVVELVNCFIATHVNGQNKAFISKHPETDIKVAQATAKLFAKDNNISYDSVLRHPDQPILTVLKHKGEWTPAELHVDKITLLKGFMGNQKEAIAMANAIAMERGADSIPSIGISLAK